MLTQPKEGAGNEGLDNAEANLICSVGDALVAQAPAAVTTFTIVDLLGQGTFGQVFRCVRHQQSQQQPQSREQREEQAAAAATTTVAVKVVKNKPVRSVERGRAGNAMIRQTVGPGPWSQHTCAHIIHASKKK